MCLYVGFTGEVCVCVFCVHSAYFQFVYGSTGVLTGPEFKHFISRDNKLILFVFSRSRELYLRHYLKITNVVFPR